MGLCACARLPAHVRVYLCVDKCARWQAVYYPCVARPCSLNCFGELTWFVEVSLMAVTLRRQQTLKTIWKLDTTHAVHQDSPESYGEMRHLNCNGILGEVVPRSHSRGGEYI